MKIKTDNIEFESFGDGICNIYTEDEEGNKINKYTGLGFSNKVLGFQRYFTAAANQVKTNRVIKIPQVSGVDNHDTVEVQGVGRYRIELIQNIFDTNPPSIDLTLSQLEMLEAET